MDIAREPPSSPWLSLCLSCGYDLTGQTERCPECGRPLAEVALSSSGRAARWLTRPSRWLIAPIVVFLLGVVAWHAMLRPATGHGFESIEWYAVSVMFSGGLVTGLHALAYTVLARKPASTLRARVWFLTLPALHAWWILWPLGVLLGLWLASALDIKSRSAVSFFFDLWPVGLAPIVTLALWRAGWWGVCRWLGVKVHPGWAHWLAAGLIGTPVAAFFVMSIAAFATIGV